MEDIRLKGKRVGFDQQDVLHTVMQCKFSAEVVYQHGGARGDEGGVETCLTRCDVLTISS